MQSPALILLLADSLGWLAGTSAQAHHAFAAEFDRNAPVSLEGKVTKIEWINPHAWIHLGVPQTDGGTIVWMVEGGTPNTLLRAGLNKNTLSIGEEIVVRGYQAKDKACKPACKANGRDITLTDGSSPFVGSFSTESTR